MRRWIGLLALALLAGCGNDSTPMPPVENVDLAGANGGGCTLDSQCGNVTPRCDKNSGTCVPCLPDHDNCMPGTHCAVQNGSYACGAACRTGADCPKNDAGASLACCNGI